MKKQHPYLKIRKIVIERKYNPKYGDDRICACGHVYYKHFDSYDNMLDCGCKYCSCDSFKELKEKNAKTS